MQPSAVSRYSTGGPSAQAESVNGDTNCTEILSEAEYDQKLYLGIPFSYIFSQLMLLLGGVLSVKSIGNSRADCTEHTLDEYLISSLGGTSEVVPRAQAAGGADEYFANTGLSAGGGLTAASGTNKPWPKSPSNAPITIRVRDVVSPPLADERPQTVHIVSSVPALPSAVATSTPPVTTVVGADWKARRTALSRFPSLFWPGLTDPAPRSYKRPHSASILAYPAEAPASSGNRWKASTAKDQCQDEVEDEVEEMVYQGEEAGEAGPEVQSSWSTETVSRWIEVMGG
ncbi:unnamed protein product [Protopolystoma xenopodis]|uniref:Uncharacterized protein n=1 Tax=Protopolystoma xenopodis TaxID=117903 RepID=A0A448WMJ9_9PLAT|nr:unnamed protein product [Protopolystoma xenopodis]